LTGETSSNSRIPRSKIGPDSRILQTKNPPKKIVCASCRVVRENQEAESAMHVSWRTSFHWGQCILHAEKLWQELLNESSLSLDREKKYMRNCWEFMREFMKQWWMGIVVDGNECDIVLVIARDDYLSQPQPKKLILYINSLRPWRSSGFRPTGPSANRRAKFPVPSLWAKLLEEIRLRHSSAERRPEIADVKNGVPGRVRSGLCVTELGNFFAPENNHWGKLSAVTFRKVFGMVVEGGGGGSARTGRGGARRVHYAPGSH
jgi:hypothetical protein